MIVAVIFHVRPGVRVADVVAGRQPRHDRPVRRASRGRSRAAGSGTRSRRARRTSSSTSPTRSPARRFPRHLHPGPELISDAAGTLTIFSSPEMVITRPNTPAEEGPYDTPTPLPPGSFAVVQGYGIHRAMNDGKQGRVGLVAARPRRVEARVLPRRAARVRQAVRQPGRRQRRGRDQRRPEVRLVRPAPGGVRLGHPQPDHPEHRRARRRPGVRRRADGQLPGLPRQALRPLPVHHRGRPASSRSWC